MLLQLIWEEFKIRKLFACFEYLPQPLFSINLVNGTWKSHHSLNLFGKKVIILKNLSIKKSTLNYYLWGKKGGMINQLSDYVTD